MDNPTYSPLLEPEEESTTIEKLVSGAFEIGEKTPLPLRPRRSSISFPPSSPPSETSPLVPHNRPRRSESAKKSDNSVNYGNGHGHQHGVSPPHNVRYVDSPAWQPGSSGEVSSKLFRNSSDVSEEVLYSPELMNKTYSGGWGGKTGGENEEEEAPFLPPSGMFETGDEYVESLREQLCDFTEMGRRQRKFTEEAVAFYDDRKNRHTWVTMIVQLVGLVLEAISSCSHLHSEKAGLKIWVGIDKVREIIWWPAIISTIGAHTSDSLEATDRLILKSKDHRDFWDQIIGWAPKVLITLAAIFIVFAASVGECNKTWKENAGEIVALQLFWTIYNTLIHLPMRLYGTVDFLNIFVNKCLYKHVLHYPPRATPEQLQLLSAWVENMSEEELFSGVAFDRSRWPTFAPVSYSKSLFWTFVSFSATFLSAFLLVLSTIVKTESSQEGLNQFVGFYGSIIIAVLGQGAVMSLSARWPYHTILRPFELLKKKEESGDWIRVRFPKAFAGVYFFFLFMASFACFSSFYSAQKIIKLPGFLEWSKNVFIYSYGVHFVLYAACAGFDFTCRCTQALLESARFDEKRIRMLRQATKLSLTQFAMLEDFDMKTPDSPPVMAGRLN